MSELIVAPACNKFCSLLLSKPLVLLDIPPLKGVVEKCRNATRGCCNSKDALEILAERNAFNIINSLKKEETKKLRKMLIENSSSPGINIVFEKTNRNIIL